MSSISQMERSSSQTRMLATQTSCGCGRSGPRRDRPPSLIRDTLIGGGGPFSIETAQPQDERGSLPWLGARPNLAFMRLHNLVNDSQPEPSASLEVRLEGLEDFFDLLRTHARTGVSESNLPGVPQRFESDGQRAAANHRADGILAEIPKHLLDLVKIGR